MDMKKWIEIPILNSEYKVVVTFGNPKPLQSECKCLCHYPNSKGENYCHCQQQGYKEGRQSVLDEWKEEKDKLLQGFNYKKGLVVGRGK